MAAISDDENYDGYSTDDFELSEVRTAELKERHQDITNFFAIYEKSVT